MAMKSTSMNRHGTSNNVMTQPFSAIHVVVLCFALVCITLLLASCGGGGGDRGPTQPPPTEPPPPPPPPTPASASITIDTDATVAEKNNPKVGVTIQLSDPASELTSIELDFAGTATRDYDYAVETVTVTIAANENSATTIVDIYRDFEEEGDETIEVSLGTISGNAEAGETNSVTVTIEDERFDTGEPDFPFDPDDDSPVTSLLPLEYTVTDEGVQLSMIAIYVPFNNASSTTDLVAEWSTDRDFANDKREFGRVEVHAIAEDSIDFEMVDPITVVLPIEDLLPNTTYYVRVNMGDPLVAGPNDETFEGLFSDGFQTDENGNVQVTCRVGDRPASDAADPLFEHQWHMVNTGQTAFAEQGGVEGADLRMNATIASALDGAGVNIGIVDSGLEICHPDLAANVLDGGSYNFAYGRRFGTLPDDPFLFSLHGDHGTSVAGVAAAVADNGQGGRGVGPGASLVAFNPAEAGPLVGADFEGEIRTAFLKSLGGSSADPDSSSVDIFNMSFGIIEGTEPIDEEFLRLFQMATRELRDGLGAIYVKAAGNSFDYCDVRHPLEQEIGCNSANSEPDQNVPYVINVGAFNANDVKSHYSSTGANLWVVAPSDDGIQPLPGIITTDQVGTHGGYSESPENTLPSSHELNLHGDYESVFGGTSASAPATAGAIAVILGEHPELTWRDVKHVLANTARHIDPERPEVRVAFNGTPYIIQHAWRTNAAGYRHHNWYGFGAVDLDAAMSFARTYEPNSLGEQAVSDWFDSSVSADAAMAIADHDGGGASTTIEVSGLPTDSNIEAVVVSISAEHQRPSDLSISIEAPSGTRSVVNPPFNAVLASETGFHDWELLSNAFYGEDPSGTWTINVVDLAENNTGSWTSAKLKIYYGRHVVN